MNRGAAAERQTFRDPPGVGHAARGCGHPTMHEAQGLPRAARCTRAHRWPERTRRPPRPRGPAVAGRRTWRAARSVAEPGAPALRGCAPAVVVRLGGPSVPDEALHSACHVRAGIRPAISGRCIPPATSGQAFDRHFRALRSAWHVRAGARSRHARPDSTASGRRGARAARLTQEGSTARATQRAN